MLTQADLDIADRTRTNPLPWHGQFSPQLVEVLIRNYATNGPVLDPFSGSGTVAYEALRAGLESHVAEVNPAAFVLSRFYELASLQSNARLRLLKRFAERHKSHISVSTLRPLRTLSEALHVLSSARPTRATSFLTELLLNLPKGIANAYLADARALPLQAASINTVITSPPYINVFNYHQQHRHAVEQLGYSPLDASRHEIGANRKFRQNRYLTVLQYCLDIALVLDELARVLIPKGVVVLVVGVESRVLGAAFDNAAIVSQLLQLHPCFNISVSEFSTRTFTNRFGMRISERVIVASRSIGPVRAVGVSHARDVATNALHRALTDGESTQPEALKDALLKSLSVEHSPIYGVAK